MAVAILRGGSDRADGDAEGEGEQARDATESLVPARIDRLSWSRSHTRMVIALGVAWVLDGLEITIAANVTDIISKKSALAMSSSSVAFSVGTIYLLGEVAGRSCSGTYRTSGAGATSS